MCKASNKLGEAVNTCSVEVIGGQSLILDSQHQEGYQKLKHMEAKKNVGHGRLEVWVHNSKNFTDLNFPLF